MGIRCLVTPRSTELRADKRFRLTPMIDGHCQVDVLRDKVHAFALDNCIPLRQFVSWASQSVVDYGRLIKSADYAPRLELLHHLVPIVAGPHQMLPTPEMIRHLPMRG